MASRGRFRAFVGLAAIGLLGATAGCGSKGDGGDEGLQSTSGSSSGSTGNAPGGESQQSGSASGEAEALDSSNTTTPEQSSEASSMGDSSSLVADDSAPIPEAGTDTSMEVGSSADSGDLNGCTGGKMGVASDGTGVSNTRVSGYGNIQFNISTQNQIVALKTTLAVPPKPVPEGTLFLWPGLQPLPGGQNYDPIGNGVLQPVLTWGGTCAPGAPNDYSSWWISGQYVNPTGPPGHTGCMGGPGTDVAVGDKLDIDITLSGTVWTQTVTDEQTRTTVKFDIDMLGQAQDWAIFSIEIPDGVKPVSDVVFTSTMLTFAAPDEADCQPSVQGSTDYFSTPLFSSDGKSCCVSRIILRAQGVAATTQNMP